MMKPTEKRFEDQIESYLTDAGAGYIKDYTKNFDTKYCLLTNKIIEFIQISQPQKYEKLKDHFFEERDTKIFERIDNQISQFGVVHVLKNGIDLRDVKLNLYIRVPKSLNNPDHILEYKKNKFILVRQLEYKKGSKLSIDTVLFINGIPIITIELKNQLTGQDIDDAIKQYKEDRSPEDKLLSFKRCFVHFGLDNDEVVMTTKLNLAETIFLPFNKGISNPITNGYKSEYLWKEILIPESLSKIIENYVHVSKESESLYDPKTDKVIDIQKEVLIFPRYHQLEVLRNIQTQLKSEGVGKNFLIQHTTGSGKSYEIGWLSHLLSSLYQRPEDRKGLFDTVLVITDRKNLDSQIRQIVESLQQKDGVVEAVTEDSQELRKYIEQNRKIITTTIQKFPVISKQVSRQKNKTFAVIIDEVHSSQLGKSSQELRRTISDIEEEKSDNSIISEIKRRGKLENVSFFGFTGTPKKETIEIFGRKNNDGKKEPFHVYSMERSIHENFTLNVLDGYVSYKTFFKLNKISEEVSISSKKDKSKIFKFLEENDQTIDQKVEIILNHFIDKSKQLMNNTSRGMVVVSSRPQCIKFFKKINKVLEERGEMFRSLVSFSDFEYEGEKYSEKELNREVGFEHSDIPKGFKHPKYRLLVVSNKFQTGYNEPLLQSMYVDKKLNDIKCVQTYSRLNRTKLNKKVFILDFKNKPEEVQSYFQKFYGSIFLVKETDPDKLHDLLIHLYNYGVLDKKDVKEFVRIYLDFKREDGKLQPYLNKVLEKWSKLEEDEKKLFKSQCKSYVSFYDLIIQVINYQIEDHFQHYLFFQNLISKLIIKDGTTRDLSEYLDLQNIQIVKSYEGHKGLEQKDHDFEEIDPTTVKLIEDTSISLKDFIMELNNKYDSIFSESQLKKIINLQKSTKEIPEIKNIVNLSNSEEDCLRYILSSLNESLSEKYIEDIDFYKKIEDPKFLLPISKKIYQDLISKR